jgi:hypothetical protein
MLGYVLVESEFRYGTTTFSDSVHEKLSQYRTLGFGLGAGTRIFRRSSSAAYLIEGSVGAHREELSSKKGYIHYPAMSGYTATARFRRLTTWDADTGYGFFLSMGVHRWATQIPGEFARRNSFMGSLGTTLSFSNDARTLAAFWDLGVEFSAVHTVAMTALRLAF